MPSSTNKLKKITPADLLEDSRKSESDAEIAGVSTQLGTQYILGPLGQAEDEVTVGDAVTAGLPPNLQTVADSATAGDAVTNTTHTTHNFTNAAESVGNMRWQFSSFTKSTGAIS